MRTCIECQKEKTEADFPRNKNHPDGSGLSSYCSVCCEWPDVHLKANRERNNDCKYRDPKARRWHDVRQETREINEKQRAQRVAYQAIQRKWALASKTETQSCYSCRERKTLDQYPKDFNAPSGRGYSGVCKACYDAMPDGKKELARARTRNWRDTPEYRQFGAARRKKEAYARGEAQNDARKCGMTYREWKKLPAMEQIELLREHTKGGESGL